MAITTPQPRPPLPPDAVVELTAMYRRAQNTFRGWVLNPPGGTENAVAFRRARAAELAVQVDRELAGLGQRTDLWIARNVPAAMQRGLADADRQARELGVAPEQSGAGVLRGSTALIERGAAEVFARDIAADLARARGSMGTRTKALLRETAAVKINAGTGEVLDHALTEATINRVLAGGVIAGAPRDTIRRLREELRAVAGDQIVIDGRGGPRNFEVGYYAELVARTKTAQAMQHARHERLRGVGLDLVMIVGRVSANFCTEFLGKVFSLSGRHERYPALSSLPGGGPPFHPQCSKGTRAWVEKLADPEERAAARLNARERSLLGKTATEAQRAVRTAR